MDIPTKRSARAAVLAAGPHTWGAAVVLTAIGVSAAALVVPDLPLAPRSLSVVALVALRLLAVMAGAAALASLYRRRSVAENAQQARLAALVEGSNDAIVGQSLDGVITDWNRAAELMFGYSAREAVGAVAAALIVPPERRPEEAEFLSRVAGGLHVPHFATRRMNKKGNLFDVAVTISPFHDTKGQVIGISKTLRDISEQRAAETDLAEARSRLAFATEAAGVGLWEWNLTSSIIIWDDTMLALYGLTKAAYPLTYEAWKNTVHPEDLEAVERATEEATAGGKPLDATYRIIRPDGEVRYTRAKGALSDFSTGQARRLLGASIDVTSLKARELEIEILNATLERQVVARTAEITRLSSINQAVMASSAHGIVATDLDGKCIVYNPAAERLYGYAPEEILGTSTSLIHGDEQEMRARVEELSAELGRPIEPGLEAFTVKARLGLADSQEWTCIHKDGTRRPVLLSVTAMRDDAGDVLGFLGILVDLSERVAKERALAERERFLKAVTDHSPDLVGYWDADQRCRFANTAYRNWFGKTSAEIIGIRFMDLLGADVFALNHPHLVAALRGEPQSFSRTLTRPDGTVAHVRSDYVPDVDDDGVRGAYVFVHDVTELTEAKMNLELINQTLNEKTIEAKTASHTKSTFLANMSHEIRTPMNGILGILTLLSRTELPQKQAEYVAKAYSATHHLLRLLNDILYFSKIDAAQVELEVLPFDLHQLMGDVMAILSATVEGRPIELTCSFDDESPCWLEGDAFRIRQVLLNVIGNALKFTENGRVAVAVGISGGSAGSYQVEFSVEDSGIGIAPEQLNAIFHGFTQGDASTSRRFGGTGLGLTISHQLVERMGGQLQVESELGVGSRFHFKLSLPSATDVDGPAAAVIAGAHNVVAPAGSRRLAGLRFLLVEDQDLNREIAEELLTQEGAVVETAAGGMEGVTMALTADPPFDAVLMDIQMPETDGYEATRLIRLAAPHSAPIIAMTAGAMASDRAQCMAAGMSAHIAKPIDIDQVVETIVAVCRPSDQRAPSAPIDPSPPGIIDLDAVLRRLGGNIPLAKKIFSLSNQYLEEQVTALIESFTLGDTSKSCSILHNIKSTALTVGLTELASYAEMVELELAYSNMSRQTTTRIRDFKRLSLIGGEALWECLVDLNSRPTTGPVDKSPSSLAGAPAITEAIAGAAEPGASPPRQRPLRILLVEDSPLGRTVALACLEDTPHRVDIAVTGAIACEMFTTGQYDLVLMDRQMPVMDGLTATRAMRAWEATNGRPPTPIIALTASMSERDRAICLTAGCTDFLSKPTDKDALLNAIFVCAEAAPPSLRRSAGSPTSDTKDSETESPEPQYLQTIAGRTFSRHRITD